jgi:hypothetical protein
MTFNGCAEAVSRQRNFHHSAAAAAWFGREAQPIRRRLCTHICNCEHLEGAVAGDVDDATG